MNHRAKIAVGADVLTNFVVPIVELKLVVIICVLQNDLLVGTLNFFQRKRIAAAICNSV